MHETKNLSNLLINIDYQQEKSNSDDTPNGSLDNSDTLSSESNPNTQFNMAGSMLSKEFFLHSVRMNLSRSALIIYIYFGFNCDIKTGKITRHITIDEIASVCDIAKRSVSRAFAELQEKGFISRTGKSVLKGTLLLRNI